MKKGHRPITKVKNPEPNSMSPDWVVWAAWADRITFEEIKKRSGYSESEVIKLMRKKKSWVKISNIGKMIKKRWKKISILSNVPVEISGLDAKHKFYPPAKGGMKAIVCPEEIRSVHSANSLSIAGLTCGRSSEK